MLPPGFQKRFEQLVKDHVEENINNPTEVDYAYARNTMLKVLTAWMEWQLELAEAGHRAMQQPK